MGMQDPFQASSVFLQHVFAQATVPGVSLSTLVDLAGDCSFSTRIVLSV